MEKLAIEGGVPVREKVLAYGRQYIDDADISAVVEVLKSDFLTCGPKVAQLEQKLCEMTKAKYAVAVSNGTAALHVACLAAGITKGDEVIVAPMTFAASANCVLYCGATPVFADIDKDTYTISPEEIEKRITPCTKAVIAVDFTGQACDYTRIKEICKKKQILLIEDAAHSIGTVYDGVPVGSLADITTFSFHPVKTITAGEGGAVLTNSAELYEKINLYAKHGITRDEKLIQNHENSSWYYEQQLLGYNYRITDMQCALCKSQLEKLEKFAERRKEITKKYNEAFGGMSQITLQKEQPKSDTVRHLYIIRLNTDKLTADRKQIYDALHAENIGVNVHYIPIYLFPYYQSIGYRRGLCPQAEALYEQMITIPLYYAMSEKDVCDVICAVKKVVEHYTK
ncbi:MAG: UDP-4-amino-4,6-dideoxy-N-acetyl-beta-L-altrosamine transaminase [Christensenellaceae bacterium]